MDGILVQLPLPPHVAVRAVIERIDPAKDVDGFHPLNAGRLVDGLPALAPCTPRGVMKLLEAAGVEPRGARAVVLGRSAIVGRPMATLLLTADATVTVGSGPQPEGGLGSPRRYPVTPLVLVPSD